MHALRHAYSWASLKTKSPGHNEGRAASTDRPCADALRTHTCGRGPRHSLCPRPGPDRDGHQPLGRCGPETATRQCNAGFTSVRSGSPVSPSSHNRAPYATARRRPRCTCTWGAPTDGSSGPTTARRGTRRPTTSHLGIKPCGWPCVAPRAPYGWKSSALGWCSRRRRRSLAQ